jgi:hypothetical protein
VRLVLDERLGGGFWATDEDGNRYTCFTVSIPGWVSFDIAWSGKTETFWRRIPQGSQLRNPMRPFPGDEEEAA